MSASLTTRRLGFTLLLAIVIASAVGLIDGDAAVLIFLPSWLALFLTWPYMSQKLAHVNQRCDVNLRAGRTSACH